LGFDTRPAKNWLAELVRAAGEFPQTAIFQSKILLWPQGEKINSLGNRIHFLGFGFCSHCGEKDRPEFNQPKEIAYASGTATLIKKEALAKIGLLDEKLMFMEDLDFGWRARLAGFQIRLVPLSRVYHHYEFGRYSQKYYFLERARFLVLLKNYQGKTLLLLAPALFLTEIAVLFYALLTGWLPDKIRALIYVGQNLGYALKERVKVQKLRRTSDWGLRRQFFPNMAAGPKVA
jgi:GT2 family glycosyltransferase